jgi:hypothetical protein
MSIEWIHGAGGSILIVDSLMREDRLDRQCYHLEIGGQRKVVDIPHVELELLRPRQGVAAMALRPTCDARAYIVTPHLLLTVQREILDEQRARANKRHVAFQNIEELRQLVETRLPHEGTQGRDALVVRQQLAVLVSPVIHRLELDDLEDLTFISRPVLKEKYARPFVGKIQPHDEDKIQWRQHDDHRERNAEIKETLEEMSVHNLEQLYLNGPPNVFHFTSRSKRNTPSHGISKLSMRPICGQRATPRQLAADAKATALSRGASTPML